MNKAVPFRDSTAKLAPRLGRGGMRTIAVIGRKGGSGKTTIAVHLAVGLHLRGRRTVVADIDPQRSALEVLRARQDDGPCRPAG